MSHQNSPHRGDARDVSDIVLRYLRSIPHHNELHERNCRDGGYAVAATLTEGQLSVEITLVPGRRYCCYDVGCLTGGLTRHPARPAWQTLRRAFWSANCPLPSGVTLRLAVHVPVGVRSILDLPATPHDEGVYAFRAIEGGWVWHRTLTE